MVTYFGVWALSGELKGLIKLFSDIFRGGFYQKKKWEKMGKNGKNGKNGKKWEKWEKWEK